MFQIDDVAVIFCLQLWGNSENSNKTKLLNKDEIKKQLIEAIIINNAAEIDHLNEAAEKLEKPEDAANITNQYEENLCTKGGASYLQLLIKAILSDSLKRRKNLSKW